MPTPPSASGPFPELDGATIADLGADLRARKLSIRELAEMYVERIEALDRHGPRLLSVIELNPEAMAIADALDHELRTRGPRGPLHGIPVLLKDNIDTADQMLTTAGSLALDGFATAAGCLRRASGYGKPGLSCSARRT